MKGGGRGKGEETTSTYEAKIWEVFPHGQHKETVIEKGPTLHFVLAKLSCVNLPGGTGFEGMQGSWRAAEALTRWESQDRSLWRYRLHWRRSWGLKRSWREDEAWYHMAERVQKRLLAKVQPSCNEDPRTLKIPTPWDGWSPRTAVEQLHCGVQPEPIRYTMCAFYGRAREQQLLTPFVNRRLWVQSLTLSLYTFGLDFSHVTISWFFLLGVRKYVTISNFTGTQLRNSGYFKETKF